jgi:phage recombination protein Bet
MTTALVNHASLDAEQVDLVKRTICKGATDDELSMFLHQCRRTGLDPFSQQIHAVKRWDSDARREVLSIQVGIAGLRLVAERTDRYAPGREPTFAYDGDRRLVAATAYVKKLAGGSWHEVASTAHYAEYVQTKKDGSVTKFWSRMPHVMLAKCAEAQALRRAFPMELSGLYTSDEMAVESPAVERPALPPPSQAREDRTTNGSPAKPAPALDSTKVTDGQRATLDALRRRLGMKWSQVDDYCQQLGWTMKEISWDRAQSLIQSLQDELKAPPLAGGAEPEEEDASAGREPGEEG